MDGGGGWMGAGLLHGARLKCGEESGPKEDLQDNNHEPSSMEDSAQGTDFGVRGGREPTWGLANISREEPVGRLPGIRTHQVEFAKVRHVKDSESISAAQAFLPDLKMPTQPGWVRGQTKTSPFVLPFKNGISSAISPKASLLCTPP